MGFAFFCALFFPVTRAVKGVWLMSASDHRWANGLFIFDPLCLVFLVFMAASMVMLEWLAGATPGKRAFGIRVICSQDAGRTGVLRPPGLARSLVRNELRLVDGLPLNLTGVVLILRSRERARLGERLAGTRVVAVRRRMTS
jgi:uncharacterized RDD family membrane protein YckC